MYICLKCNREVKNALYETGDESYCGCQCTLNANFNSSLWIDEVQDTCNKAKVKEIYEELMNEPNNNP